MPSKAAGVAGITKRLCARLPGARQRTDCSETRQADLDCETSGIAACDSRTQTRDANQPVFPDSSLTAARRAGRSASITPQTMRSSTLAYGLLYIEEIFPRFKPHKARSSP